MSIRITGELLWTEDSWTLPQTYRIRTSRDGALESEYFKGLRWLWWWLCLGTTALRDIETFSYSYGPPLQMTQLIQDCVVKPASLWHPHTILLSLAFFNSPNNLFFLPSFLLLPFLAMNLHIPPLPSTPAPAPPEWTLMWVLSLL